MDRGLTGRPGPSAVGARAAAVFLGCIGVALSLGVVARSAAPRPAPSFAAAKNYPTGKAPAWVAIGDLNGDGHPEVVTANVRAKTLSVLLNQGNGSFRARTDYTTEGQPGPVLITDLNGDARPELATLNHELDANIVSVLPNRGNGRFEIKRDYTTGAGPAQLAIADLNVDGKPDLVTANTATVSVLLNRGDGSFEARRDYGIGESGDHSLAIGDLNGDRRPDVAVTVFGEGTVAVLLNRGDGTLALKRDYATGGPNSLAIADLNGDGKPDLVAGGGGFGDTAVYLLLNRGDGTFQPSRGYRAGLDPSLVGIADVNGDGKPDLVTANSAESYPANTGGISVLLNRGDGSLEKRHEYNPCGFSGGGDGYLASYVAIGDLDGDGRPELAVAGCVGDGIVFVLSNRGDGRFRMPLEYRTVGSPNASAIADLNGDGKGDLVTVSQLTDVSVLTNTPGLCNVQRVVRMTLAAARQKIARVNCRVGKVSRAYSRMKKGRVISQKPKFGAVRRGGAKVNLVLSKGRRR